MNVSRRDFAVASALAFGASAFLFNDSAGAQGADEAAIARHIYLGESELDGKQSTTRIGALQLWQKQDAGWKLVARQGFRLPA
jgi:hypothetical protein